MRGGSKKIRQICQTSAGSTASMRKFIGTNPS
jgi:hypothetical protein